MPTLDIALLGSPQISLGGKPVETDRRKAIALLAYLVVTGKPQSRDHLAALLWPEYTQASALAYLRRTLWEVNSILGSGWIETGQNALTFNPRDNFHLDTETFSTLVAEARTRGRVALEEAVSLYRGDFLDGFVVPDTAPFEDWQVQQAEYFRREFSAALEKLVEAYEQDEMYEEGLSPARRWLALEPLDEAAHRALMRLQAGLGDRSGMARQYESCVRVLKDELRVAPQPETTALYEKLIRDAGGKPTAEVQKATVQVQPIVHLPIPGTPFVGRRPEVEQVKGLILDPDHRLVTLIGPGGTGKTRLSLQAATEVADAFADGVWFVPLAPLQSAEAMVPALAKALDFSFYREEESPRQQLLDYLSGKQLLLVLDNFEHLVEPGQDLVSEILSVSKKSKILVTSRERLNLQAEQLFRVTGMRFPEAVDTAAWTDLEEQARPFSAIQLFVERARRVRPDFRLTPDNLSAVLEICSLVDGMPLGIELAAAWLEVLTPKEIAAEIVRSLDFLQTELRDVSDRQRSMRAVFESSWKLLNTEEQKVFQELTIFPGSFSRQAAQHVSGASLRILLGLANKSWLQPVGEYRYQLHEVLKQYGLERLKAEPGNWQAAKDRHADYFMGFIETQAAALCGPGQIEALSAIELEWGNHLQPVWEWLVERDRFADLVHRLLPGMLHFCMIRDQAESFIALTRQARSAVPFTRSRDDLLYWAILGAVECQFEAGWNVMANHPRERVASLWTKVNEAGLVDEMGSWYLSLVAAYNDLIGFEKGVPGMDEFLSRMRTTNDLWMTGYALFIAFSLIDAEPEEKRKYLDEALSIFQKSGMVHEQGVAFRILGEVAWRERSFEEAIRYNQTAMEFLEKAGDQIGIGWVWFTLAEIYLSQGEFDKAFHAYHEQRHLYEKIGNQRLVGINLSWESMAASRYSTLEHAMQTRQRSLAISLNGKSPNDIAWANWEMGELYRLMGDLEQARAWYDKAIPEFEQLQDPFGLGFYQRGRGDIALSLKRWEEARQYFQAAVDIFAQEFRSVKSWSYAYVQAGLGRALIELGNLSEARQALEKSVHWAEERGNWDLMLIPLVGFAALASAQGKFVEAVELATFVVHHRLSWNETRSRAEAVLAKAAQNLTQDMAQSARARGSELTMDAAVSSVFGV